MLMTPVMYNHDRVEVNWVTQPNENARCGRNSPGEEHRANYFVHGQLLSEGTRSLDQLLLS